MFACADTFRESGDIKDIAHYPADPSLGILRPKGVQDTIKNFPNNNAYSIPKNTLENCLEPSVLTNLISAHKGNQT